MWGKKSTQKTPEAKCNERRVGDALAHSIRRMISDNTPREREEPATPPHCTEMTDTDTIKHCEATQWEDGIKTQPQTTQNAGARTHKTPKDRQDHNLRTDTNAGNTNTETPNKKRKVTPQ